MKTLIIIFSTLILQTVQAQINEQRMIDAIAYAERSHGKIGAKGEYSDWQIMPSTWYEHTHIDLYTSNYYQQRTIALKIMRHFARILENRHIAVTPHNLAVAWNAGPYATHITTLTELYAYRANRYYSIP